MPSPRVLTASLPLPLVLACHSPEPTPTPALAPGADAPRAATPALSELHALIVEDRRQFEADGPGRLAARIPGVLRAELSAEGLTARSGDDTLHLRTSTIGGRVLDPVDPVLGACAPTSELVGGRCAPAAELHRGDATEWWTSSAEGVRQGWTVDTAPHAAADELALHISLEQGAPLRVDADGRGATLLGSTGQRWRYRDLLAWDAADRDLPARMERDVEGLVILVDTAGAVWPVTVDPLLGPATWVETKVSASDGATTDLFSRAVAPAGDVDGDGYDDVIVGAYLDDDGGNSSGSAYVYYGSASGIDASSEDKLTASDAAAGDWFGVSVGGGGDLDGDGYADVIVGATADDDNGSGSGSAYVYYGSATGISASSEDKLTASDGAASDFFGWSVAVVGDHDGDGYDDLIVGAPYDDDTASNAGAAYVYLGSGSGIDAASETKLTASDPAQSDGFGWIVAGAGDLDGDGTDDLAVGVPSNDDLGTSSGAVYLYYGSTSGASTATEAKLTASDGEDYDFYGFSVAGAGDVDDDGYDDLVVGAYGDDDIDSLAGALYVYYGSASGLGSATEDKLTAPDTEGGDYLGVSVAGVEDVDGDGVDDVLVGASSVNTDTGRAYVFYGSASGLRSGDVAAVEASDGDTTDNFGRDVAAAGDTDGDGRSDLLIGAYGDDDAATNAGAIYVVASKAKLTASDGSSQDYFGWSLAGVGDIDGDGHDDIIVGAYGDGDVATGGGAAYVYYGATTGLDLASETKLTAPDGALYDAFGRSMAAAGDLDADGYDDLAVGSPYDDDDGSSSGAVYLYMGTATGLDATPTKLTASNAAANALFGASLAGAGDLDADGYDDLVVGAYGQSDNGSYAGAVYVYLGSSTGLATASELQVTPSDAAAGDYFGYAVSGAGDLDGDGYDDVALAAPIQAGANTIEGAVYVYYGSASGLDTSSELKLEASDPHQGHYFGFALGSGGDLDGDGYDDLVVGAHGDDDRGNVAGAVYVYYGSASGLDSSSEQELGASDADAGDYFGRGLAMIDDLDGDGYADVIVGADGADYGDSSSGAAYVYFGSASGLDSDTELVLGAPDGATNDYFGRSLADAGDLDGDGFPEVIVGAYGDDDEGSWSGSVYVFSGGCRDLDGDGTCADEDCDDGEPTAYPGASEISGDGVDNDCDGYESCFVDDDGDGYTAGTVSSTNLACDGTGETDTQSSSEDCDDTDATIHPGATEGVGDEVDSDCDDTEVCYADADDDGYIDGSTTVSSTDTDCTDAGEGLATDATGECDDSDAAIHPGATEGVGDEVDQDCDDTEVCYADADDDGYIDGSTTVSSADTDCTDAGEGLATDASGECDDDDPDVNPGATEAVGDEVDSDCDGAETCYADADDDGYTDGATTVSSSDEDCSDAGEGTATDPTGECDDTDASIHPGAIEGVGDEVDSDCDDTEVCYADADDDGYTDGATTVDSADTDCSDAGEGLASDPTGECDDADATINPGATEGVGDELDQDCDGGEVCYADADNDGYVDGSSTVTSADVDCIDSGEGLASDPTGECDDADPAVNPAATELPGDEVDQDCDGAEVCYVDADDDGYTDGVSTVTSADSDCADTGEGTAADPSGECDDTDATVNPGATELPGDLLDSDCDGLELCYVDADDDGVTAPLETVTSSNVDCSGEGEGVATDPTDDCDDTDAEVYPGAVEEVGDEVDSDCDGVELCYADADGDLHGAADGSTVSSSDDDCGDVGEVAASTPLDDCDDSDPDVHPDAPEVCDAADTDEDCDGLADDADESVDADGFETFYADADGDGYGDPAAALAACDEPAGHTTDASDCDDTDPSAFPGATEVEDDGIDQDCDGSDASTPGSDGSGDGEGKGSCSATSAPPSGLFTLIAMALVGVRRRGARLEACAPQRSQRA